MAQMMFNPSEFTTPKAKPLPILLLLDTSGSMNIITNPEDVRHTGKTDVVDGQNVEYVEGGITRISILNDSVRKMLATLAKFEREATEFLISIITFGEDTRLVIPPSPAGDVRFSDMPAGGMTPLGEALKIAKEIVASKIPNRSYRPLIVLVSDGAPNDNWEEIFDDFIKNGRTSKCDRMALAIGDEADRKMLGKFVEGTGHEVFEADKAEQITDFFKFVTMSTIQRTQSQNPNETPADKEVNNAVSGKPGGAQNAGCKSDDDDSWM